MSIVMAVGNTNVRAVKEMTLRTEMKDNSFGKMMGDNGRDVAILPWKPVTPKESTLSVHEEKMNSGKLKDELGQKLDQTQEPETQKAIGENTEAVGSTDTAEKTEELTKGIKELIKETLGISDEELEEMMAELGMTGLDLLQPQEVYTLCLTLEGAEEMDLLTDADLYQSLEEIVTELNSMLEGVSAELGIRMEDLAAQLQLQAQTPVVMEESEEITTGDETELQIVQTNADGEQVVFTQSQTQNTESEDSEEQHSGQEHELVQHMSVSERVNTVEAPAVNETTSFTTTSTQDIMDQMLEAVKVEITPEVTELKLQLHPESLGNVHVQLTAREGMLTASFTAQNEVVKNVLETQLIQLKESLEEKGIQVEAVEVKVDAGAYNEQYQDAKENEQQEAFEKELKKHQPRRINIMDYVDGEELSELDEAEELTVKIMKENGNSLDYSA